MKTGVLISIIVPVYNVKSYLVKCIDSLCSQTYKEIEIILVDDGSTDGSGKICDAYARNDPRITVIHKSNGGLVSARKAGAEIARGLYVVSVDGDDWIDETRIENLAVHTISSSADMIYLSGWHKEYGERSTTENFPVEEGVYDSGDVFAYIQDIDKCFGRKLVMAMGCWAIERRLYQKMQAQIDDRITVAEDLALLWLCLLESKKVCFLKDNGYHYVMRETSLTPESVKLKRYEP